MTAPISNHEGLVTRRSILIGVAAASLLCAPAIVRAASLMPVRRMRVRMGLSIRILRTSNVPKSRQ